MKTAVVVCCYGVFSEDPMVRPPADMSGYRRYLNGVARVIQRARPEVVIICGGHTNPRSGLSEAASVLPYLSKQVPWHLPYRLEERSRNTVENIEQAMEILQANYADIKRVLIICDRPRGLKVRVLTWKLGQPYTWSVRTVGRPDTHRHSTWSRQWLLAAKYLVTPSRHLGKP